MKRFIIALSILLVVSLGLMSAFAGTADSLTRSLQSPNQPAGIMDKVTEIGKKIIDAKSEAQVDPLADPNKIQAAISKFEGLQGELDELDRKGADELPQWFQKESDNRMPLAKNVHDNLMEEIKFIRKLAVEENAKKTIAAIDGLMLRRQQRYENVEEKFRQQRMQLRRARTSRGRLRQGQRGQMQDDQSEQNQETQQQYRSRSRRR